MNCINYISIDSSYTAGQKFDYYVYVEKEIFYFLKIMLFSKAFT